MSTTDRNTVTTDHFVAVVKIEKVSKGEIGRSIEPKRIVEEVTTLTVRAETLDSLKTRLSGHIELIEE